MEKLFLFVSFLTIIGAAFGSSNVTYVCSIRTRILNNGDSFEPRPCFFCECRNSILNCKDQEPDACPEPPCDPAVQVATPDRCCKICPDVGARCRFNGMSVEDGETFKLNPCGACNCHEGKLTCDKECPDAEHKANITTI